MPVEKQTTYSFYYSIGWVGDVAREVGQRLTISNRQVTKLGFWLKKRGTPIGILTFVIRKVSDDEIICSKLWGNSSDLPAEATYEEVEFDTPQTINGEVRIVAFAQNEIAEANGAYIGYERDDVKADEHATLRIGVSWVSQGSYDTAYIYTYETPVSPTVTTQAVTNIAATTAIGNGNVTSVGVPAATQHGVCWNTTGTPTTDDDYTEEGVPSTGAFTSAMAGLVGGTKYYVRAYATNSAGTTYGDEVSFVARGWYRLNIKNINLPYEDLDKTKGLHVILKNLSPTAKNAGASGEVVIEVSYEPAA